MNQLENNGNDERWIGCEAHFSVNTLYAVFLINLQIGNFNYCKMWWLLAWNQFFPILKHHWNCLWLSSQYCLINIFRRLLEYIILSYTNDDRNEVECCACETDREAKEVQTRTTPATPLLHTHTHPASKRSELILSFDAVTRRHIINSTYFRHYCHFLFHFCPCIEYTFRGSSRNKIENQWQKRKTICTQTQRRMRELTDTHKHTSK